MTRTCFHPISTQQRQSVESRARSTCDSTKSHLALNEEYIKIGVTIHLDIPFELIQSKTSAFYDISEYSAHIIKTLNDSFSNNSNEFIKWSTYVSAQSIADESNMDIYKAQKLYEQLHSPILGHSKISFVLRKIIYNSKQTSTKQVDARSNTHIHDLKVTRWPSNTGTLNIWITIIMDNILGFATFPFTSEPQNTFGVVVDYRTTHPTLGFHNYGLNQTITHEVGHCFGLFHTFMDPYAPLPLIVLTDNTDDLEDTRGDGVKDTPIQSEPTFGNTLLTASSDADIAFVNVMNYVHDAASLGFTKEQVDRMTYFVQNDVRSYISDIESSPVKFNTNIIPAILEDIALTDTIPDIIPDTNNTTNTSSTNQGWKITCIVLISFIIFILICLFMFIFLP